MDLFFNVEEIQKMLGINKRNLYSLIKKKEIPCIKLGKTFLFPKSQIKKQFLIDEEM